MLHWEAEAELLRRANRVSLRTLGRRPKAVGATADGGAVFELGAVRLVLRDDAAHFNRLVPCSECAREVAGTPILRPEDLESPPSPVICPECTQNAPGAPQEAGVVHAAGPSAEALDAVHARLDELAAALERRPTEDATRAAVEAAVAEASDRFRAEVAASAEAVATVEERVKQTLLGLAGVIDSHRAELAEALERRPTAEASRAVADAAVDGAVAEVRAELAEAVAGVQAELATVARRPTEEATRTVVKAASAEAAAQLRAELAEALAGVQAEMAAAVAGRPTEDATRTVVEAAVAAALARTRAELAKSVAGAAAHLRTELTEALAGAQAEMAAAVARRPTEDATRAVVEAAVGAALVPVTAERAATRAELAAARAELAEVADALAGRPTEEATRAMVDAAVAWARAEQADALTQAREELHATADAAAASLQTVEAAVRETAAGLAGLLDAQRTDLSTLAAEVARTQRELERLRDAQEQLAALDPRESLGRLSAMVAALRSDLEGGIDSAAQEAAALTGARAELVGAQAELERRLGALAQAVEAGDGGLHALEQRILEELYRVNVRLERLQPPVRAARAPAASLVETLDAQLQAAEGRLAARAGAPRLDALVEPGDPG